MSGKTGFISEGIRPRVQQVFRHRNFKIAVSALIFAFLGLSLLELPPIAPSVQIKEAMAMVLAFMAMGFGVSVTALALILALPLNRAIALTMVNSAGAPPVDVSESGSLLARDPHSDQVLIRIPGNRLRSGYLDLVFIFIWAALLNMFSAIGAITTTVISGNDQLLTSDYLGSHISVSVVAGLSIYTVTQMGTALATIFQLAKIFQNLSLQQMERDAQRLGTDADLPESDGMDDQLAHT